MADYIRRVVSGNKARFKDDILGLELGRYSSIVQNSSHRVLLDLVYVTDQVIIMGYPASGIEGLYRNRREDAVKFLKHRHGKNFWVFNFCPVKENSYEADVFEGRVSRYPFPDHQ
jgi:phosphatidylinositol-3,4,5-trisphosphate 3-phosphatase/dual-specificity protein phosphatase PTEN